MEEVMGLFAFDDAALLGIAAEGTPCFAYRLETAARAWKSLRAALPERIRLAYAVKANPHGGLLRAFAALGSSFDCASKGELARVAALGIPGSRILFAGPGKRREELALALGLGARIEVDGIEDLQILEVLLAGPGPGMAGAKSPLRDSLRVHPRGGIAEGSRIIGGTGPSAFGVDEEDVPRLVAEAKGLTRVRIAGLQVFASSNELHAPRLLENHRASLRIARGLADLLASAYACPVEEALDCIDLGGGLGIPYEEEVAELDLGALGSGLQGLLGENPWYRGELVLEPGRYLSGPCGVYLTRVVRIKESRGETFAILEGGINHLLRPALTGQAFPVRVPGRGEAEEKKPYTLAGPLCTSLDRLGTAVLSRLLPGDILAFGQTGAYGFTEAMGLFLSHDLPRETCL